MSYCGRRCDEESKKAIRLMLSPKFCFSLFNNQKLGLSISLENRLIVSKWPKKFNYYGVQIWQEFSFHYLSPPSHMGFHIENFNDLFTKILIDLPIIMVRFWCYSLQNNNKSQSKLS